MLTLRKKLLIPLIFFMVLIITTVGLALAKGNTSFTFINTTEVVDKIRAAEKLGETIELQEKDLNSVLGVYIGKGRTVGGLTVKAVNITFEESNLVLKIPIIYKGVHLLISTSGKCTYLKAENKVQYEATYYKIGNLPLPKGIVESILKKYQSKNFQVATSSIKIYLAMFPFSMKEVTFNKNNVMLSLNKNDSLATLFPKLPTATTPAVEATKNNEASKPKVDSSVPAQTPPSPATSSDTPTVKQPDNPVPNTTPKVSEETKSSVAQISGELSNAAATLESANEKQILQIIMNTVNSVSSNPAYNYAPDIATVSSLYKNLTPEGRSRVKLAIMSNVDMNTATKLKNTFGL